MPLRTKSSALRRMSLKPLEIGVLVFTLSFLLQFRLTVSDSYTCQRKINLPCPVAKTMIPRLAHILKEKLVELQLREGPALRTPLLWTERGRKPSTHRIWTHRLLVESWELYRCATITTLFIIFSNVCIWREKFIFSAIVLRFLSEFKSLLVSWTFSSLYLLEVRP